MTINWRRPEPGVSYPLLLHAPGVSWWRPLMTVLGAIVCYGLTITIVVEVIVWIEYALSDRSRPWQEFYSWSLSYHSPWGLLAGQLGIATLIPISLALVAIGFRTRPGWVMSVAGRARVGWMSASLAISALVVAIALVVAAEIHHAPLYVRPQPGFWLFALVLVVSTPLQAAGEEYFFRGLMMQTIGSVGRSPWIGIVGSALVFAAFHGTQNFALFADRFLFGILAGVLVWKTGGLEAAIAAHVINNVFAFIQAGLTTSMAEAAAVQEVTWGVVAWHLGTWVVVAIVLYAVARWRRIATVSS